jgi:multidrug efflux pump subunit AcrA (membrane-fusion protein)
LKKAIIRAPADGTILELNIRNPGQSVGPNNSIARIAPKNAELVIKSRVTAQDIGRVEVGQKVNLRVSAFPYPDYGTINGRVKEIAADVTTIAGGNNSEAAAAFFEVTIIPDQLYLRDQRNVLDSGMEVTADIIAQEETVLRFMLRKARLLTDI